MSWTDGHIGRLGLVGALVLALVALVVVPSCALAQGADSLPQAAATITAAELGRDVAVLATDSMHGRPTPSPALEQTAAYIAAEFQRLGLRPGVPYRARIGDSTWFQRYPLPGQQRFDYAASRLACFQHGETFIKIGFTERAHFIPAVAPPVVVENVLNSGSDQVYMGSERVFLVTGRHTAASLAQAEPVLQGAVALYVRAPGVDSAADAQTLATLYAVSAGVVVLSDADSARFAAARHAAQQVPVTVVDGYLREAAGPRPWPWVVAIRAGAFASCFANRGIDLAALRAETTPRVQPLPRTFVFLSPHLDTAVAASARTAPNVLGWLEGTDSVLQREMVVISAHMDGAGERDENRPPDQTTPLARAARGMDATGDADDNDDNAVGIAGLLALARALSIPGVRPRRSVLFVATSGTGRGQSFWGSNVAAGYDQRSGFEVQNRMLVANLTLDRIGRLQGDSVLIHGIGDLEAEIRADWVAAAHPELRLRTVDAGTAAALPGDQLAFIRHNVPSLYVHAGGHGVAAGGDGKAVPLDLAAAARVVRLVFYLTQAFATADQAPRWSPEGRRQLLPLQSAP